MVTHNLSKSDPESTLHSPLAEPQLSELLSESTEFADAAQQWECEKAELVNTLRMAYDHLRTNRVHFGTGVIPRVELVIRKYEVPA